MDTLTSFHVATMMASFRTQRQDKSPSPPSSSSGKHQHQQQQRQQITELQPRGRPLLSAKKLQHHFDSPTETTADINIRSHQEAGGRSAGYANTPFSIPTHHGQENTTTTPNQERQYSRPLQQQHIYISRDKRAAAAAAVAQEGEEVSVEAAARLRLKKIKSAAREIDEQQQQAAASPTITISPSEVAASAANKSEVARVVTMSAFPASRGDDKPRTTSTLPPSQQQQQSPQQTTSNAPASALAATPVSPSLTSPAAPPAPPPQAPPLPQHPFYHHPQHPQYPGQPLVPTAAIPQRQDSFASAASQDSAATRDPATSVASAAAAVALHQQHQQQQPRGIPHVYHDFANVPDSFGFVRKKTGGVTQPFPEKLHELLEKESTADFHQNVHAIVGWLPHGRAFLVRKPKEFTRDIMPKYFRQTKLTSFQRQLNLYGFRRITQGTDAGAYYHELFLRGRPQLCLRMVRQKVKGTGHKQPADAQTEPNFYALPPTTGGGNSASSSPAVAATPAVASPPTQPIAPSPPLPPRPASPPAAVTTSSTTYTAPLQAHRTHQTTVSSKAFLEMSPGTRGVHGAASLLKGIAAGVAPSRLASINPNAAVPFLGPPVEKSYDGSGTAAVGSATPATTSQSKSLLAYRNSSAAKTSQQQHQQQHQQQQDEKTTQQQEGEEEQNHQEGSNPTEATTLVYPSTARRPLSSYSSLLWGAGAPVPGPTQTPRATAFLWPHQPATVTTPSAAASKPPGEQASSSASEGDEPAA